MAQRGLPTPYNLKPKSKGQVLTTPMKKMLTYFLILIIVGTFIFKAVPDSSKETEIQVDRELNKQSLQKPKPIISTSNPKLIKVDAVEGNNVNSKKMVTDLDKLKEDLKKINKQEEKD